MAVVFTGRTALWLWRSNAAIGPVLNEARTDEVLEHLETDRKAVDTAIWSINLELHSRWCGSWRPEILAHRKAHRQRTYVKIRSVPKDVKLYAIGNISSAYVVSPEDALVEASDELDIISCALLGLELCGSYGMSCNVGLDPIYGRNPRTTREKLLARASKSKMSKTGIYASAMQYVGNGSNSPMESKLFLIFTLPQKRGGLGLPAPKMNQSITLTQEAADACGSTVLSPDFLWEDQKQIIEYDSTKFHFEDASRYTVSKKAQRDRKRINAFSKMNYTTWSMMSDDVRSYESIQAFMEPLIQTMVPCQRVPSKHTETLMKDTQSRIIHLHDPLSGMYLPHAT